MNNPAAQFSLKVDGIIGLCPVGERWAKDNMSKEE